MKIIFLNLVFFTTLITHAQYDCSTLQECKGNWSAWKGCDSWNRESSYCKNSSRQKVEDRIYHFKQAMNYYSDKRLQSQTASALISGNVGAVDNSQTSRRRPKVAPWLTKKPSVVPKKLVARATASTPIVVTKSEATLPLAAPITSEASSNKSAAAVPVTPTPTPESGAPLSTTGTGASFPEAQKCLREAQRISGSLVGNKGLAYLKGSDGDVIAFAQTVVNKVDPSKELFKVFTTNGVSNFKMENLRGICDKKAKINKGVPTCTVSLGGVDPLLKELLLILDGSDSDTEKLSLNANTERILPELNSTSFDKKAVGLDLTPIIANLLYSDRQLLSNQGRLRFFGALDESTSGRFTRNYLKDGTCGDSSASIAQVQNFTELLENCSGVVESVAAKVRLTCFDDTREFDFNDNQTDEYDPDLSQDPHRLLAAVAFSCRGIQSPSLQKLRAGLADRGVRSSKDKPETKGCASFNSPDSDQRVSPAKSAPSNSLDGASQR